jgi:hypothetical protein
MATKGVRGMKNEIINEFITHLDIRIGTYRSDDVIKVSDVFKMCEDIKEEILNKKENNDGNT